MANPSFCDFITLAEAVSYTSEYRKLYPNAIKAYLADNEKVQRIMNQEGCIGIRIYNGYSAQEGRTNMVIVGVDADRKDMTNGLILEKLHPCPNECDVSSPLY